METSNLLDTLEYFAQALSRDEKPLNYQRLTLAVAEDLRAIIEAIAFGDDPDTAELTTCTRTVIAFLGSKSC